MSVELRLCHGCSFSRLRCTCKRILLDSGRKIATSCRYIGGSATSSRHPSVGESRVQKQGVAQRATQKNGTLVPAWLTASSAQVRNTLWHHCTPGECSHYVTWSHFRKYCQTHDRDKVKATYRAVCKYHMVDKTPMNHLMLSPMRTWVTTTRCTERIFTKTWRCHKILKATTNSHICIMIGKRSQEHNCWSDHRMVCFMCD